MRVSLCVNVRAFMYALRIVSADIMLHFVNTLIIINITFFIYIFFNNHETGIVLTKRFQFKFGNFQKVLA